MPTPTIEQQIFLLPDGQGENRTIFILGSTGSGKTTLTANLLLAEQRFIIFDIKEDFTPEFFTSKTPVVKSCNVGELANWLNESQPDSKMIFTFADADESAVEQYLNAALWQIYEFQKANHKTSGLPPICIVLDETNRFVETSHAPTGLIEVVQRGRSVGIHKIFGAQWFGTIPTWVRDSFSEIYVFRHADPAGITRLKSYGFDADEVMSLPQYTCLHASASGIERIKLVASKRDSLTERSS